MGLYIISIAKAASKKIGALVHSMKFLSPEVALYLYKSNIHSCMEYCCLILAGSPICYLELLDKLQKQTCRTVDPSLATCLEPLSHHWNVVSLTLFTMKGGRRGGGAESFSQTSFSPVTFTNVEVSRQNFLNFILVITLLPHLCKISRSYLVPVPNY